VHLFVYGTLRKGLDNPFAELLAESASYAGPGKVRGEICVIAHYPGLVLSGGGWVMGDLFHFENAGLLRTLDEYEGTEGNNEFRRVSTQALLESGEWVEASVYIYAGDASGKQRIESGDFLEWLNANRQSQ